MGVPVVVVIVIIVIIIIINFFKQTELYFGRKCNALLCFDTGEIKDYRNLK